MSHDRTRKIYVGGVNNSPNNTLPIQRTVRRPRHKNESSIPLESSIFSPGFQADTDRFSGIDSSSALKRERNLLLEKRKRMLQRKRHLRMKKEEKRWQMNEQCFAAKEEAQSLRKVPKKNLGSVRGYDIISRQFDLATDAGRSLLNVENNLKLKAEKRAEKIDQMGKSSLEIQTLCPTKTNKRPW